MENTKEITRRDYLKRLPEELQAEVIENMKYSVIPWDDEEHFLSSEVDSLTALGGAFVWPNTPKGAQYWLDIDFKYFQTKIG